MLTHAAHTSWPKKKIIIVITKIQKEQKKEPTVKHTWFNKVKRKVVLAKLAVQMKLKRFSVKAKNYKFSMILFT